MEKVVKFNLHVDAGTIYIGAYTDTDLAYIEQGNAIVVIPDNKISEIVMVLLKMICIDANLSETDRLLKIILDRVAHIKSHENQIKDNQKCINDSILKLCELNII